MRLRDLLGDVDVLELVGDSHVDVVDIEHDSRRARPGALHCCIRGATADGHDHAAEAVRRGAAALLVERVLPVDVPQARVASVRGVLGPMAARIHGDPSCSMQVLGVTGTNGKTTVTYLLESIGRAAGFGTGVIGTTGARFDGEPVSLGFTTPEAPELQALFARMRDAGTRFVAMEVSSHALAFHRVDGTRFGAACFTNLSPDHLDLHHSMDEYFEAKARLFEPGLTRAAAVTADDPRGAALAARAQRAGLEVVTFGLAPRADVRASEVRTDAAGTSFVLRTPTAATPVRLSLLGRFNVGNALAAAATALAAGLGLDTVGVGLEHVEGVPGRMERVELGQPFTVLVDYAHTPEALERVVAEARELAAGHEVLVAFGCGGDRDAHKRPLMGRAAAGADRVVLTTDNPRSEDPAAIADAAERGLRGSGARYTRELDRRRAIHTVIAEAGAGDVVVIAGKGHESDQTIGDVSTPFDDRVVAREALRELAWT